VILRISIPKNLDERFKKKARDDYHTTLENLISEIVTNLVCSPKSTYLDIQCSIFEGLINKFSTVTLIHEDDSSEVVIREIEVFRQVSEELHQKANTVDRTINGLIKGILSYLIDPQIQDEQITTYLNNLRERLFPEPPDEFEQNDNIDLDESETSMRDNLSMSFYI